MFLKCNAFTEIKKNVVKYSFVNETHRRIDQIDQRHLFNSYHEYPMAKK